MTTRSLVGHLYRRAGFGGRPEELDAAEKQGYELTVQALLGGLEGPDPGGDAVALPSFAPYHRPPGQRGSPARLAAVKASGHEQAAELRALQTWWFERMISTSAPLREKLTFLWHGHFATGFAKVRDAELMYLQNDLFRRLGSGSFEALTLAVAKSGAMMRWLDTATDKASAPNENFARELMEIFTLGIGNYTETDVREAARAFTGWAYDRLDNRWLLRSRQHDNGIKSFLGHRGNLGGEDVISIVTRQPASARWVTAKLWGHLAYPVATTDPVVTELSAVYAKNLDVTELLGAIFRHPDFVSVTARSGLVKQPIEWLVGTARLLDLHPAAQPAVARALHAGAFALDQVLFDPPDVAGWPQNGYWLATSTALSRLQVGLRLAELADLSRIEALPMSERVAATARLLAVDGWGPTTVAALTHAAGSPVALVGLALSAPEYVVN